MTLPIIIGLWGWLYCSKLTDSEQVFSFMPSVSNWLASLGKSTYTDWEKNYFQNAICKWGYGCGVCHAGMVALMVYLVKNWQQYSFENHFVFIVISLSMSYSLEIIQNYLEQ